MKLAQVTATWPPVVSGVGDYSAMLSRAFAAQGVECHNFVLACAAAPDPAAGTVTSFLPGTLRAALEEARPDRVMLHFVGYGFAKRGLCFWLAREIAAWRRADPQRRLVTIFHEIYADGPVWRPVFWVGRLQRLIARRLLAVTDRATCTTPHFTGWLERRKPGLGVVTLPVTSNIGELSDPPPLGARAPRAVVFGGPARRRDFYAKAHRHGMAEALDALGITEVLDIGPEPDLPPADLGGREIEARGPLPADEISRILSDARVGLMDYPLHVFPKSGIGAAYLSHGMLCVNLPWPDYTSPILSEGREMVPPRSVLAPGFDAQSVATAGHRWYGGHDRAASVARLRELLEGA